MWTLAHAGAPPEPHDVWHAWNADPVVLVVLLAAAVVYRRGAGRTPARARSVAAWRRRCFAAALAVAAIALLSPLDAMSGALASAHMVQHVLLVLAVAPLLAL